MDRRERHLRKLLDRHGDGAARGWRFVGVAGNSHYLLRHESGAVCSAAGTPSDYRNERNLLARLRHRAQARRPAGQPTR